MKFKTRYQAIQDRISTSLNKTGATGGGPSECVANDFAMRAQSVFHSTMVEYHAGVRSIFRSTIIFSNSVR
jgi:hypothetical protein